MDLLDLSELNYVTSQVTHFFIASPTEEEEKEEERSPGEAGVNRVYVHKTSLASPLIVYPYQQTFIMDEHGYCVAM
jgi:hypothetical protein